MVWASPLEGRVTSHFGAREGRHHDGIDITARDGTTVRAAGAGVVRVSGRNQGYGLFVEIEHVDNRRTRYAHLDALWVRKGQQVDVGTPLGPMGSTGRVTGPHLHFEVYEDGEPVDPLMMVIDLHAPEGVMAQIMAQPVAPLRWEGPQKPARLGMRASAEVLPIAQRLWARVSGWLFGG